MLRYISWEDIKDDSLDLSGEVIGWGLNLSSRVDFTKALAGHFCVVLGKGMANYMNHGPIDIGIENNFSDPERPIVGTPLPVLDYMAFLDMQWNEKFSSSAGYSFSGITNSDGQALSAYKTGSTCLPIYFITPLKMLWLGSKFNTVPGKITVTGGRQKC